MMTENADNTKPNMSEFSLTIPYFTCREWGNQCVEACGTDSPCASSCREDNPCGAQDPQRFNESETSASGTTKPTGSASVTGDDQTIFTDTPGSEDSEGGDDSAASLLSLGRSYGLGAIFGGMFLTFALF